MRCRFFSKSINDRTIKDPSLNYLWLEVINKICSLKKNLWHNFSFKVTIKSFLFQKYNRFKIFKVQIRKTFCCLCATPNHAEKISSKLVEVVIISFVGSTSHLTTLRSVHWKTLITHRINNKDCWNQWFSVEFWRIEDPELSHFLEVKCIAYFKEEFIWARGFLKYKLIMINFVHWCFLSASDGASNKTTSRASGGDLYADPVAGAQGSFQLRLQEMVMLEGETIKFERQRKLGRRRLKLD